MIKKCRYCGEEFNTTCFVDGQQIRLHPLRKSCLSCNPYGSGRGKALASKFKWGSEGDVSERQCLKCKKIKLLELFSRSERGLYGRRSTCKSCEKDRRRQYSDDISAIPDYKICAACLRRLSSDSFHRLNGSKSGLKSRCKCCAKGDNRKRYLRDKEKILAKGKEYRDNNPDKEKSRAKKYRETHDRTEYRKRYNKENKDKIRARMRKYKQHKRKTDPAFKLEDNLRRRLNSILRKQGAKKCDHTIALIGCSINELKQYLESKFQPGMSWDNYGFYGWHVDHKIPIASFNLTDPVQQKACFHYTNLQPLWAEENLVKGAALELDEDWLL